MYKLSGDAFAEFRSISYLDEALSLQRRKDVLLTPNRVLPHASRKVPEDSSWQGTHPTRALIHRWIAQDLLCVCGLPAECPAQQRWGRKQGPHVLTAPGRQKEKGRQNSVPKEKLRTLSLKYQTMYEHVSSPLQTCTPVLFGKDSPSYVANAILSVSMSSSQGDKCITSITEFSAALWLMGSDPSFHSKYAGYRI